MEHVSQRHRDPGRRPLCNRPVSGHLLRTSTTLARVAPLLLWGLLGYPFGGQTLQATALGQTATASADVAPADQTAGPEASAEEITAPPTEHREIPTGVAGIVDRPIRSLTADIRCKGKLPSDLSAAQSVRQPIGQVDVDYLPRQWPGFLYQWEAPGLYHRPLYFEEVNLERYGYTHRRNLFLQPVISGGRFVATITALPYLATLRPPCERVYPLGHYRPGSCAPFRTNLVELDAKAAAVQGAAVTGLIFAIP